MWYLMSKMKKTLPPFLDEENDVKTNTNEKAELLNDYFVSQTHINEVGIPTPLLAKETTENLDIDLVEESEVLDQLKLLDRNKAKGPDELSPYILRECAMQLFKPITAIFNKTLSSGKLPKEWKRANVTPIHKKGEKNKPQNYRPISLTSCLCKVMEKIIFKHIYNY